MVTKRQIRSGKVLKKKTQQKQKFPELLIQIVESSDIILEILDARFIKETRNEEIEKLISKKKKQILYVLNKSDLINKDKIQKSILYNLRPHIFTSALKKHGGRELRNKIKMLAKNIEKGEKDERIAVGVMGYPNTGKSSIINVLVGKTSAKVGAKAGFTKGIQKLKLSKEIVLLDSPGVIPKNEYSTSDQLKMSKNTMVGARDYHKIKDPEIIVSQIIDKYKEAFEKHYKIKIDNSDDLIEGLGKKQNILKKGGLVNTDQVARKIIKDWQEGKIRLQ
jgi:ribosome biogenesis GTPase A